MAADGDIVDRLREITAEPQRLSLSPKSEKSLHAKFYRDPVTGDSVRKASMSRLYFW